MTVHLVRVRRVGRRRRRWLWPSSPVLLPRPFVLLRLLIGLFVIAFVLIVVTIIQR